MNRPNCSVIVQDEAVGAAMLNVEPGLSLTWCKCALPPNFFGAPAVVAPRKVPGTATACRGWDLGFSDAALHYEYRGSAHWASACLPMS